MNPYDCSQVPLPEQQEFPHPHKCRRCKNWTKFGIITYLDEIEDTVFFCKDCKLFFNFNQLPQKTKFREPHKCVMCKKESKIGMITYCPKCEDSEFVCSLHIIKWFNKIVSDEYGYEYNSKLV